MLGDVFGILFILGLGSGVFSLDPFFMAFGSFLALSEVRSISSISFFSSAEMDSCTPESVDSGLSGDFFSSRPASLVGNALPEGSVLAACSSVDGVGVDGFGDRLVLGGVFSIVLVRVGDCLGVGEEVGDGNRRLLGGDVLEVGLGLGDVFPGPCLVLVDGLRGGEDEGDDLRLLGVGVILRSLRGVVVLVFCWGVLGGGVGDLGRLRLCLLGVLLRLEDDADDLFRPRVLSRGDSGLDNLLSRCSSDFSRRWL